MAEEVKKTSGRPKKAVENKVKDAVVVDKEKEELKATNSEMAKMIKSLQEQMTMMQSQMNGTKSITKDSSKKIKVVNLMTNKLNLNTSANNDGKPFKFNDFGSMVSMRMAELEDIISIPKYRSQAEEGLFYICDSDAVEELDLTEEYKVINDKKAIEHIMTLSDDSCIDMFCGLSHTMQESLVSRMAEMIADGKFLDKNRLATIQMRTEFKIEDIASDIKRAREKMRNK